MNEPYEQIKYRGYNINIYRDEDAESPRQWDNLGTIYTRHRNYQPEKDFDKHFEYNEVFDKNRDFLISFDKQYIGLKVYLYDHSGQTVSTSPFSCRWDSGLFGIIAVEIEKVKKEYGWRKLSKLRRIRIEEHLKAEIALYDSYLRGDVYRFEVVSDNSTKEELDSCCGFYGDESIEHIKQECQTFIDSLAA